MAAPGRGPLRIAIEDFLESFKFGDILFDWLAVITGKIEEEALDLYQKIAQEAGVEEFIPLVISPKEMRKSWKKAPALIAYILMATGGLIIGLITGAIDPVRRITSYKVDKVVKSFRPDPSTAWAIARRDPSYANKMMDGMKDLGLDDDTIAGYRVVTEQIINAFQLEALRLRGLISPGDYQLELAETGWTPSRVQMVQDLSQQIPNAQDLIRMAVREAWNEEIVARFDYDKDFPPEFAAWMEKQGFTADWAKKYWRAHWEIPSVQAGYEMLHRLRPGETDNPFTEADIETLLKTADVPVFFRKRLIDISYSPYTRVDVRRMYGAGVLTAEDVYKSYRDLGYNEERAQNLTQFTITIEKSEEKGLTREAITGAYRRGIMSRDDTTAMLNQLGYDAAEADFWLDLVDYDLSAVETNEILASIQSQYVNGVLNEQTVMDPLGKLNLPAERQARLLDLWTIKRNAKIDLPSRSDLESFYKLTLIDEIQFDAFLKLLGYRADVIPMYIQRSNLALAEDARKEAERAVKEADRLIKLKTATALQRVKAIIDADIAEARVTIADLRVALFNVEDVEEKTLLKNNILETQKYIAEQELAKAMASIPPETV